ncbi:Fanconi anemia core complex-associated protein 20 [Lacerta agilis]|uniref:Fanconi anemia core complex-associated protein 20 n=1 Tax=Lacerta agilis TaxID=80427 RepID=UPI00141928C2|nr:Fanconi anemia core complex-associated protein 20 [Lacerta agilis]
MAEEERAEHGGGSRGGKLSLKRKRRQQHQQQEEEEEAEGRPSAIPRRAPTFSGSSFWFEEQGLSGAEIAWMTLLKSVDPHLHRLSLEKVVNLPKFLTKSSQTTNPQPAPETFDIGMKQFQWTPFPHYHTNNSRSKKPPENQTLGFTERGYDADGRLSVISPAPKQNPIPANKYTAEETTVGHNNNLSPKLEGREMTEMCLHSTQQNSPGHSSTAAQSQPRVFVFGKLWKGATAQSEGKGRKENKILSNDDKQSTLLYQPNNATSVLPVQESPAVCLSVSNQENTEDHREEILALSQCPMCQIHFTGKWSKLDIDGHLAKCLAESDVDVIW